MPRCRPFVRDARALAALLLLASGTGCKAAVTHLGEGPADAGANADSLFVALGAHFGPYEMNAAMAAIEAPLARYSLIPSQLFGDSSIWSSGRGDTRTLELGGHLRGNSYVMGKYAHVPPPTHPGDYHGTLRLQRIGREEYEWRVHDILAVGDVRVSDLSDALTAIFLAAQGNTDTRVRAGYQAALPRTTRVMSQLFSLDTIRLRAAPSGATDVMLDIGFHPQRMATQAPELARYLAKYVTPASGQVELYDDQGATWWTVDGSHDHFTMHFRVRGGSMVPLTGAPRSMPQRVHARIDLQTKFLVFHVGFQSLVADIALTREDHDKGFVAIFQHEPEWLLPPLVEHMLRTSLSTPFANGGSFLTFDVHDSTGGETLALREFSVAIQESSIMRWLGGLGNSAMSDYRQGAEKEADRWVGQLFTALRADTRALVPATPR
ncbi:MAG TPA: hypothetical protein VFW98_17325 [Gemmatimonadaceae bacterium]|nr:hypothetical protein [Gemmatimonadaceae bacterium]